MQVSIIGIDTSGAVAIDTSYEHSHLSTANDQKATNRLVVAWTSEGGRSVLLANAIGASALFIPGAEGASVLSRYLAASRRTLAKIRHARPKVIVVQNPPIVAVLICAIGAFMYGSSLIIDSHTGAFVDPKWRRFSWLHRILAKCSAGLIVHNTTQKQLAKDWATDTFQVGYVPLASHLKRLTPAKSETNWILIPASGAADEPLETVRLATLRMPKLRFVITGSKKRIESCFNGPVPHNVEMTGYLSSSEYLDLIRSAPKVLALTTRPATLLSGAFEALALKIPLIVSDTDELRNYFGKSAVYVGDSADEIINGIKQAEISQTELANALSNVHTREEKIFTGFLKFLNKLDQ